MKEKKKVAIYMRCTTNTTDKYKGMYNRLTGYIKTQPNWDLVEFFYDNAPGNWTAYPPDMKRMFEEIERKGIEVVVVEKMGTFSAYSQKRTDIERMLKRKGVVVITLYTALREQRRAEKARSQLQYEMIEDALQRADCLTNEQFLTQSIQKAGAFVAYINDSFEEILEGETGAPYKKVISIQVGDKICCIPLTARSLLILRDSIELLQRSVDQ